MQWLDLFTPVHSKMSYVSNVEKVKESNCFIVSYTIKKNLK